MGRACLRRSTVDLFVTHNSTRPSPVEVNLLRFSLEVDPHAFLEVHHHHYCAGVVPDRLYGSSHVIVLSLSAKQVHGVCLEIFLQFIDELPGCALACFERLCLIARARIVTLIIECGMDRATGVITKPKQPGLS